MHLQQRLRHVMYDRLCDHAYQTPKCLGHVHVQCTRLVITNQRFLQSLASLIKLLIRTKARANPNLLACLVIHLH